MRPWPPDQRSHHHSFFNQRDFLSEDVFKMWALVWEIRELRKAGVPPEVFEAVLVLDGDLCDLVFAGRVERQKQ